MLENPFRPDLRKRIILLLWLVKLAVSFKHFVAFNNKIAEFCGVQVEIITVTCWKAALIFYRR